MSMFQLTGKIPNLFRDCSPVVLGPAIRNHYGGKSTGVCFAVGNVAAIVTFLEDCRPLPIPLEELTLDMFSATGRFHARLYLQEQGYDVGNEDRPDVLAWSVLSVWKGGKPLRIACRWGSHAMDSYAMDGARKWFRSAVDNGITVGSPFICSGEDLPALQQDRDSDILALGWAITNPDGTMTLPPLP